MDKVLSKLEKVTRTGADTWQACCPAHEDRTPSLSIRKSDEKVLLHCHAGCNAADVVRAMGLTWADLFLDSGNGHHRHPMARGLTLETYATAKKLPEQFLRDLGCATTNERGQPVVLMPYKDADGKTACVRKRIAMRGDKFRWRKGDTKDRWPLYGLWRLADMRKHGWVLLVEGESDCHTAWLHDVPALGVPGASNWQSRWCDDLDGLEIYVWQEPDRGGDTFVESLRHDLPTAKVIEAPKGVKDLSAAHLAGQDVADLLESLRPQAVPIAQVLTLTGRDPCTDMRNARRLIDRHARNLRYCEPLGGWLVWDGKRWRPDDTGGVVRMAKDTVRAIYAEAAQAQDSEERKALAKGAMRTESKTRLWSMIDLAQSELEVVRRPEDFDQDPWLLNVANGTLDLRAGELRPHDPADMLTKLAPVEYDPEATDPILDEYLTDTTAGDKGFEAYLQRAAGYTLTGLTDAEVLFMVLGPAATGKSTLIEAMLTMLGDYGAKASFDAFLTGHRPGQARSDIVHLRGARMAAAVEPTRGRGLDESLVKELTGGDTWAGREVYGKTFEYKPTFKLWLAANQCPTLSDDDTGIWRRLKRLPFEHEIPKADQDPEVKRHLCSPEGARALLAWAVNGCLMWQLGGLAAPDIVQRKTSALRADFNPIGEFLKLCCVVDPKAETPARDLRDAYEEWAADFGAKAINDREWGRRLQALGCTRQRKRVEAGQLTFWQGIGLLAD